MDTATGPQGDAAVGGLSASDDGADVESSDGHDDDNGVYDRFEDADGEELDIIATDGESDEDEGLLRAKRQAELGGKRHLHPGMIARRHRRNEAATGRILAFQEAREG